MKTVRIIWRASFICCIVAAIVSLGLFLRIHLSDFYDVFTEGRYEKFMRWALIVAVCCFISFIITFLGERCKNKLDKAKARDLVIDEKKNQWPNDAEYIKYIAIRKALYEDFRGPKDVVFHRLCDDVKKLVELNPVGLRSRMTEIATVLYFSKNSRDRKTAVDTSIEKNYPQWVTTFCTSFGVEPLSSFRKDGYETIQPVEGFLFRYLYAPSWKDFDNPQKLEEYLK